MESNLSRARSLSLSRPPSAASHQPTDPERPYSRGPTSPAAAGPRSRHNAWASLAAGRARPRNHSADAGGGRHHHPPAGAAAAPGQGHARVVSDTSAGGAALGRAAAPPPRDPLRVASAMGARVLAGGAGGGGRDRSRSPADAWPRGPGARGAGAGGGPWRALAPLREDGSVLAEDEDAAAAGDESGDDLPSPIFERGPAAGRAPAAAAAVTGSANDDDDDDDGDGGKERSRRRSPVQLSALREQMQDLRGKVDGLRRRTREDSLQRRSLQVLKPASPFTDADSWAGPSAGMHSVGVGVGAGGSGRSSEVLRKEGGPVEPAPDAPGAAATEHARELPEDEARAADAEDTATVDDYHDAHSTVGARPRGPSAPPPPSAVRHSNASTLFEGSVADSARGLQTPHVDDEPYTAGLVAAYDAESSHAGSVRDSVDSAVGLDRADAARHVEGGREDGLQHANEESERNARPADADPDVLPHESRPDAFDYETYVLDSTMGSFSRQSRRRRRPGHGSSSRSSSSASDAASSASVSTTRPTTHSPGRSPIAAAHPHEPSDPTATRDPPTTEASATTDNTPAAPAYNPDYDVHAAPDLIPSSPTVPFPAAHAPSAFATTTTTTTNGAREPHSRQNSADSVSTVATFATATSGPGSGARPGSRSASRSATRATAPAPAPLDTNGRLTPSIPPRSRARTPTLPGPANAAVVEQIVGLLLQQRGVGVGGGGVGGPTHVLGAEDEALVRGVVEGVLGACGSLVAGNGLGHESAKERRARERLVGARGALESWGR